MPRQPTPYQIGDTHNDWKVIGHHPKHDNGSVMVIARCVCGFERPQILSYLKSGRTKRCRDCTDMQKSKKKRICLCGCGEEIERLKHSSQKYVNIDHRHAHYSKIKVWRNTHKPERASKYPKRIDVRTEGICIKGGQCKSYSDCLNLDFKGHCKGKVDPCGHDKMYSEDNHFELEPKA